MEERRETEGGRRPPGGRRSRLPGDGARPLESLDGRKIAVVGLGASGRAAARLALGRGGEVYATDIAEDAETAAAGDELRRLGARIELGTHRLDRIADAAAVVVSPGIPPDAPVLRGLRERGVRWISELELAFRFLEGTLIAVTGTNGKTTTAALTAHLLRETGYRVALGGNVGAGLGPAASELALRRPSPERIVLEASSFQLADVEWFSPDVGVVTNLAPDHLDRYPDVDRYYADKARLFDNATSESRWVLNGDDAAVRALAGDAPGRRYVFRREPTTSGREAYVRDGRLALRVDDGDDGEDGEDGEDREEALVGVDELALMGRHNVANALAASLAARLAGAEADAVASGLRSFEPLPHRLEPVAEVGDVLWVNDSKATNVGAVLSAVRSLDRPIVLLLGGKDKGEDFRRLRPVGDAGVRLAVTYGATGDRIADALEGAVEVLRATGGLAGAVREAASRVRPGEIALLSPACSSFDEFESYEARGRRFRELVREGT